MVQLTQNDTVIIGLSIYFGIAVITGIFHACYRHQKVYNERSVVVPNEHVYCQVYFCSLLLGIIWPIHFIWIILFSLICWPYRCCTSHKLKPCIEEKVHNPLTCEGDGSIQDCLCPVV